MSFVERVWFGDDAVAATVRLALSPFAAAYGGTMALRSALYDAGIFASAEASLPTISVGNLTVGGTGKTPVAAWLASQIAARARPAVALRGYGGDEIDVHRRLNPGMPVVANADRVAAIDEARRLGADVVVLDDAFQHLRVRRQADIVVLSAEQMLRPRRLLPAGPWRERLDRAGRADLVVITRKSGDAAAAAGAARLAGEHAPGVPVAIVHLAPMDLTSATGEESVSLERLRGAEVLGIAAVGEPGLFEAQLVALGARVRMFAFRDHHAFTDAEVADLARRAADGWAVCTLKDAVKLGRRWPGPGPLWYVSQLLVVDQGAEHVTRLITRVLDARAAAAPTAG